MFKQLWRIHKIFNSSLLSFYTPTNIFPLNENNQKYDQKIRDGYLYMKKKRLIITTLVRNVEDRIPDMIKKCEATGGLFEDYRILIVENNSNDKTRDLLIDWSKKNPKVIVLGCGYNNPQPCSISIATVETKDHFIDRPRIEKMVYLRNIYLEEIKKNTELNTFDFVLMWDLDILGSMYLDGIANTMYHFMKDENLGVDAICSHGIVFAGAANLYYDTYAHVDKGKNFDFNSKFSHDISVRTTKMFDKRGDEPYEVNSCFSGATFYRMSALLKDQVFYDMTPSNENNLECEHVRLHQKLDGKILLNPSNIHLVLQNI